MAVTLQNVDKIITGTGNEIDLNNMSANDPVSMTGGSVSEYTDPDGVTWKVHQFTATTTATVTSGGYIEYVVVGGGGASKERGGGGAGGYRSSIPRAG